jgi:hypothetical protein
VRKFRKRFAHDREPTRAGEFCSRHDGAEPEELIARNAIHSRR